MNAWRHAAIGAAAGVAPDILLTLFGWRRRWLPESHPLVRGHRFLHGRASIPVIIVVAWSLHIAIDKRSKHREKPA